MRNRTVKVCGRDVEISVHQKTKTIWIATGSYLDKPYEGKAPPK